MSMNKPPLEGETKMKTKSEASMDRESARIRTNVRFYYWVQRIYSNSDRGHLYGPYAYRSMAEKIAKKFLNERIDHSVIDVEILTEVIS